MASPEPRASPVESAQKLLLPGDTSITCPKCKNTFGLEQGFARAALEQFEHSTEGALEAVRRAERTEADKRARQLSGQQANALRDENAELKRLLRDQGEKHAQALKEVTKLAQQSAAPQLEAMRVELAARQARIDEFTRRESDLSERERDLEARVAEAAGFSRSRIRPRPGEVCSPRWRHCGKPAPRLWALRLSSIEVRKRRSAPQG